MRVTGCMRGNAPQVVEALWAAKEEPPAKLVGFSFLAGLRCWAEYGWSHQERGLGPFALSLERNSLRRTNYIAPQIIIFPGIAAGLQ